MTRWVGFSCHTQLARLFSISFHSVGGKGLLLLLGSVSPPTLPPTRKLMIFIGLYFIRKRYYTGGV